MRRVNLLLLIIVMAAISGYSYAQIPGIYRDCCGDELILKEDSSFQYYSRFDLMVGWTMGTWFAKGHKVSLNVIPVLDTIMRINPITGKYDSLILSSDKRSGHGYDSLFIATYKNGREDFTGFTGSQDTSIHTSYYLRKNRLFSVAANGRFYRKRQSPMWRKSRKFLGVKVGYKTYRAGMVRMTKSVEQLYSE